MIEVVEISDKSIWTSHLKYELLQSWEWGEFLKAYGFEVFRFAVMDNGAIRLLAQGYFVKTKLRSHIYIPNGPVVVGVDPYAVKYKHIEDDPLKPNDNKAISETNHEIDSRTVSHQTIQRDRQDILTYYRKYFELLLQAYKVIGVKKHANFIRLDPLLEDSKDTNDSLTKYGLIEALTHVQPENKWLIDLTKDETLLLSEMSKSTRYEIRKADKDGVKVYDTQESEDFSKFWELFQSTVKRQGFVPFPRKYYQTQYELLSRENKYRQYYSCNSSSDFVTASALIADANLVSSYLHAATADMSNSELNYAPKAILWRAICDAKARGKHYFDMYGVAGDDGKNRQWQGFSQFKKSFGGYGIKMIVPYDYPLSKKYGIIRIIEKTRAIWGKPYSKLKGLLK